MSNGDRIAEWIGSLIVAALTWVSAAISPGMPPGDAPAMQTASERSVLAWAQQVDQPPIEQVGEGTSDDVESLDEGAPPSDVAPAAEGSVTSAGAAPTAQDGDVELLDQGAPPATAGQPVETVYVAPVAETSTGYVAPEPAPDGARGPILPEGFGTGRVHAVAGRSETPIGLADCHVGAVTGRAYVGLECGEDEGSSFVGHAPSFEAFPFALEAEFPFEGDEAFFTDPEFPFGDDNEVAIAATRDDEAETDVVVSARGETRERDDEVSTAPVIETGGESSVAFAQRARNRDARVRGDNRSRGEENGKKRARAGASDNRTNSESQDDSRRDENGQSDRVNSDSNEEKAKSKKGKKDKKDRGDRKKEEKKKKERARDRG